MQTHPPLAEPRSLSLGFFTFFFSLQIYTLFLLPKMPSRKLIVTKTTFP